MPEPTVLAKDVLEEAFASTAAIEAFRVMLGFGGAKRAVNMVLGGAGASRIKAAVGVSALHPKLAQLQRELNGVRSHMMSRCPPEWRSRLKTFGVNFWELNVATGMSN